MHFFSEAMVDHEVTCALVLRTGTYCTCRKGPPSGKEGLQLEGPELVMRRFDADGEGSTAHEQELAAENERLRAELRRLRPANDPGESYPQPRRIQVKRGSR